MVKKKMKRLRSMRKYATIAEVNNESPTLGLEDVFYGFGSMQDANTFIDMTERLSNYIDMRTSTFATAAAKAVQNLIRPTYMEPAQPVRKYWSGRVEVSPQTAEQFTRVSVTEIRDHSPVIIDVEFQLEIEEYMKEKKKMRRLQDAWKENTARIYNHILLHCPAGLTAELRTQPKWDMAERDQY